MKRTFALIACLGALFLAACTSESSLPNPTGKGAVRAINAIPGSPEIRFLIEERQLSGISYKQSSVPARYDDFEYNFNFDLFLPGNTTTTRVATLLHTVEANRDHVFLLTGDPLDPTITTVNTDEREFDEAATVFEMRFAHAMESMSAESVDFYLDEAVDPPVIANKVATLAYTGFSAAQDFEAGEYIITITAADDINTVLYTSPANIISARTSQTATAFDGDANSTSSIVVNVMSNIGVERRLADAATSPAVRFVHAARSLVTADIYDDEPLTNRIVAGLAHGEATADIDVSGETETYFWTPADSTATILLQGGYTAPVGTYSNIVVVGPTDEWVYFPYLPDRASVSTYAKLQFFQSALDNEVIDVYLLEADATITEEDNPLIRSLFTPTPTAPLPLLAGSYDMFVTPAAEQTVLAGPFRIDAANGDVINILILDTDDPAVPEIKFLADP